jgi:TPR repeat protein
MGNRLPMLVVSFLLVSSLLAQENSSSRPTTDAPAEGDFRTLLSNAKSGDREAQYRIALIYADPGYRSVSKNDAASRQWMLESAEQGYAPAQATIGMMYMGATGDYGKANIWLRRAAEQGNADAQFWLGTGYEQGRFGTTDYQQAFKWLREAAEQENPDAQVCLGQMYEEGEFVAQNYTLAAKWYRKAAEQVPDLGGAGQGRNDLGLLYLDGLGVPKSLVLADMWFALASVDENVKVAESRMTPAEVAEARKMSSDWLRQHPPKQVAKPGMQ